MKKWSFKLWLILGLCITLLWACSGSIDSFDNAYQHLKQRILPTIQVETELVADSTASLYSTDPIPEPLPPLERYALYGAQPTNDRNTLYVEIFGSVEKSDRQRENEEWLVVVAEEFNRQQIKSRSGKTIQIGLRSIPSGVAARLLATNRAIQPTGYSPATDLWLALLEENQIRSIPIVDTLVPSYVGLAVRDEVYQALASEGVVDFDRLLKAVLDGKITIGYPNPYTSSTALNLIYTMFWRAAGHTQPNQLLTEDDLQSPQVKSVFDAFQKQVVITTLITRDLRDIFIRDPETLQAFPLEIQTFNNLKEVPGFSKTHFVPFGVAHNSPLVGFEWNTAEEQSALKTFAEFATMPAMQKLAEERGYDLQETDFVSRPSAPNGRVLKAAQSFWKERKDGGQPVYMMLVIDTSGSMDGKPLQSVQDGLRLALQQVNAGNQVGLVSFSDRPTRLVNLAPFDDMQHKRLLAAIDKLTINNQTAMYDGIMVGLMDLMEQIQQGKEGRFYLLLLSDGVRNAGSEFTDRLKEIMRYSQVRIYPIAYGDFDQAELKAIAEQCESTVLQGDPEKIQELLKEMFQTNL
jgi:Ca-activated chloride channel homolog